MTDHAGRLDRAWAEAERRGLSALVIAPSPDLRYLTGYEPMPFERPTMLVIRSGASPVMFVPELELALATDSGVGRICELVSWADGDDPYAAAAGLLSGGDRIGVADRMLAVHLLGLQRATTGDATFEPASPVLGRLRAVKDDEELAALRRAGRAADETFRQILSTTFQGRREEEVAADLAELLVANGHDRSDFTIVGSGPNGASPHHEPGGRTILPKDVVVMDFGGELGGYFSDITRTVVVVEDPAGLDEAYQLVHEAQEAAFDAVGPGVPAEDVDAAARDLITSAGFGDRFIHRTGHGIGLEVHEPPYLVRGNDSKLERGMTFSIEPGVYLPGRFGVRIEDIVVVTDDGAERLNRSTRDLQVVD
jgi:Xaa-Pro aminopeptidase